MPGLGILGEWLGLDDWLWIYLLADTVSERRFWEFFTATIRNPNTRLAYLTACYRFADWCEANSLSLNRLEPMVVAAYVELLSQHYAPASVKQHLAAIRRLFDWLVIGQIIAFNPASSVRGVNTT